MFFNISKILKKTPEEPKLKKTNKFITNAVLLSVVNILMRGIGVSFNAYISRKIGAESMGLFTLIMSVYSFALTVALSCVNLAAVRLTSERCANLASADRDSWKKSMKSVMRSVCLYAALFGISSGILLFSFSQPISLYLLHDERTLISLKVLSFSLPAVSLASALSGFFTGLRKITKNAFSSISEQFMRIFVTSTTLVMISPGNVEHSCLAVVAGGAVAEGWSLFINYIMYVFDTKKPTDVEYGTLPLRIKTHFKDTVNISLPSAVGAYARQGLTMLEHLAIPEGLKKSGLNEKSSLAVYGLLHGIAMPLVMFPYAVIGSFTSLLIPEIAERNEMHDKEGIRRLTYKVYRYSAIFSIGACGIFVNYSNELGILVYDSAGAAKYTFILGLLVPLMYLDTAVDALLKGLGEQVYTMKVNIVDAASGLILVMLLTPLLGIYGYILTMWVCEAGNLYASIFKLAKVTGVSMKKAVKCHIKPVTVCLFLSFTVKIVFGFLRPIYSMIFFVTAYILFIILESNAEKIKKDL